MSYKLFHNNGYAIKELNEYGGTIKDYGFSKLYIDTENGNIKITGQNNETIIDIYINCKIDNKYYENILIMFDRGYNTKIFDGYTGSVTELNKFKRACKSYFNRLEKKLNNY